MNVDQDLHRPFWVSHPTDGPPRHLKGIKDARVVPTEALTLVQNAVGLAVNAGGIVNIAGAVGVGKTFATWEALRSIGRRVITLDVEANLGSKGLVERIEQATTGRQLGGRESERIIIDNVVAHLAMAPSVLVIDEVQNLSTTPLRLIKYLHDRPDDLDVAIVLVGFKQAVFDAVPELKDRLLGTFEVPPIPRSKIHELMAEYSPIFAASPPKVIDALFDAHGGRWRRWANVVRLAQHLEIGSSSGLADKQVSALLRITDAAA